MCYLNYQKMKNQKNLYDKIYEMKQCKIVPILAHPERCKFIQKEPELVYELIQDGVLIQSDYGSIVGEYGPKAQIIVEKLTKQYGSHAWNKCTQAKYNIF